MKQETLKANLFHAPAFEGDTPYLIGTRCRLCGYTSFPPKQICTKCRRDNTMSEVKLGPKGKLETFAVMQVGTTDFPAPYTIGFVRLEQGPSVFSLITGCKPTDDSLAIGQDMILVIDKIRSDKDGFDVVGWKFKPFLME